MKSIFVVTQHSVSPRRNLSMLPLLVAGGLLSCGNDFESGSNAGPPEGSPTCDPGAVRACYGGPESTEGVGPCKAGRETCSADGSAWGPCEGDIVPMPETCSTQEDDDCDGETNEDGEGCACMPGETVACYSGEPATKDVGTCKSGGATCGDDGQVPADCQGETLPTVETCWDGTDEDCDGGACTAPIWNKLYGDGAGQAIAAVAAGSDGSFAVVGAFSGTLNLGGGTALVANGEQDAFVALFDARGNHLWSKQAGNADAQKAKAVAIDAVGNVIVVGQFTGSVDFGGATLTSHAAADGFIAKFSPTGDHVWSRGYGGTGSVDFRGVASDAQGNITVVGQFAGELVCGNPLNCPTSNGSADIVMLRFAPNSSTSLCALYVGSPSAESASSVAVDSMGNAIIGGEYAGTLAFGNGTPNLFGIEGGEAYVAKIDPSCKATWALGFPAAQEQSVLSVATDAADDVVIGGAFAGTVNFGGGTLSSVGATDAFVAKYATDGSFAWATAFTGPTGTRVAGSVAADTDGNVLVAGMFTDAIDLGGGQLPSGGFYDAFAAKLDPSGAPIAGKAFGGAGWQTAAATAAGPNGEMILVGTAEASIDFGNGPLASAGGTDAFIAVFAK